MIKGIVLMKRAKTVNRVFHRVSLTIYTCWLIAFISGAVAGMLRLNRQEFPRKKALSGSGQGFFLKCVSLASRDRCERRMSIQLLPFHMPLDSPH